MTINLPSNIFVNLVNIWGTSSSDVFAVGVGGMILHYDGSTWSIMDSGTANELLGIWGTSSSDVYAVGTGGLVLHYDGNDWSSMTSGTTSELISIGGSSASDVFAVGAVAGPLGYASILHYNGSTWSDMTGDINNMNGEINYYLLNGVWGSSPSDVFAVGRWGAVLHYPGY